MLTTVDNPYDPFTQWDDWFAFDTLMGYNSCGLLARVSHNSEDLSEADQDVERENSIKEIVELNVSGIHKRVSKTTN